VRGVDQNQGRGNLEMVGRARQQWGRAISVFKSALLLSTCCRMSPTSLCRRDKSTDRAEDVLLARSSNLVILPREFDDAPFQNDMLQVDLIFVVGAVVIVEGALHADAYVLFSRALYFREHLRVAFGKRATAPRARRGTESSAADRP